VIDTIRDPRYSLPLAVLICVIVVSAVLGRTGTQASTAQDAPAASGPTVVSSPAPSGPSAADVALDTRRRDDLASVAGALDAYRAKAGVYPSTQGDFATLCVRAFDAGCLLTTVTKQLAASDGAYPYWYQSDGKTYTLFTRLQTAMDANGCPAQAPPALASVSIYCLSGGSR
jgi:hypothetical protein